MIKILKYLILFYGLCCLIIYLFQVKMIFQATGLPTNYIFKFDQKFIEKSFYMPNGTVLNTLFFPAKAKSKGLVFYNHGNRRNISGWGRNASTFTSRGYDVLFWDYPDFGKSTGKLSEENIHAAAEFLYSGMLREYPEQNIIIYGRSLGTGISTKLATNHQPNQLILETPYFNIPQVAKSHVPIFPFDLLFQNTFHTDKWITQVKCPIHIFHGTADELVPYKSSLKLAELLKKAPKDLITTLPNGHHRGLSEFEEYQKELDKLLK